MGDAAQVAHDHAEAVIQRHRDHHAVQLAQAQAFPDHVAIVEDVVMAEGRALGEAGGAGGVLDIHRLIELQALLAGLVVGQSGLPGQCRQPVPGQKAHRRRGIQADQPAQLRQPFAVQLSRLLPLKVG
ncbi:hypothetical protein D9M71_389730 [compost metagenome]